MHQRCSFDWLWRPDVLDNHSITPRNQYKSNRRLLLHYQTSSVLHSEGNYTMRNTNYVKIQPRGGELPRPSCEACKKKHNGTYGSGRFCSSSCARSVGGRTHQRNNEAARVKKTKSTAKSSKMSVNRLLNPM